MFLTNICTIAFGKTNFILLLVYWYTKSFHIVYASQGIPETNCLHLLRCAGYGSCHCRFWLSSHAATWLHESVDLLVSQWNFFLSGANILVCFHMVAIWIVFEIMSLSIYNFTWQKIYIYRNTNVFDNSFNWMREIRMYFLHGIFLYLCLTCVCYSFV